MRGNAPGAHDPNDADVWGILKAAYPGQVGACITAPVAKDSEDFFFWFVFKCCSDLSCNLGVGEVHLSYCMLGAFGDACSASVAVCCGDKCGFARFCFDCAVWAFVYADSALGCFVSSSGFVNYGDDWFNFPFLFADYCGCP